MRMQPPIATLPKRRYDKWGSGEFLASRGDRQHEGVDYCCYPDTGIFPVHPGRVSKLGFAYSDDLSFRYVEITDNRGYRCRYFYVEPEVDKDEYVGLYDCIGKVQDLRQRYEGILNHVHIEVRDPNGLIMDPEDYFNA